MSADEMKTTTDLHWSNAAAAEYPGDEYEQYPLRRAFGRGVRWERKRAETTTEDAARAMGPNTIPSREQIAQALSVPDVHHPDLCDCGQPVCGGTCHAEGEDCYCATERCGGLEQQVDAVLALLQGGTR